MDRCTERDGGEIMRDNKRDREAERERRERGIGKER